MVPVMQGVLCVAGRVALMFPRAGRGARGRGPGLNPARLDRLDQAFRVISLMLVVPIEPRKITPIRPAAVAPLGILRPG